MTEAPRLKIRFRQVVVQRPFYGRFDEYQVVQGRKIIGRFDLLSQAQKAHPTAEPPKEKSK